MGMFKLLERTNRGEARWHSSRRAGATDLRPLGLPWRYLRWWGRWQLINIAHLYASTADKFECLQITRLPWPANEGIRWRKTDVRDLWQSSLTELFENDEALQKLLANDRQMRSKRSDDGAEEGNALGDAVVGSNCLEGGRRKSRCKDTPRAARTKAPENIRPPWGTRSVDLMPARDRAPTSPREAPSATKEAPMDVDEQQDGRTGPHVHREAAERARPTLLPVAGGQFK